MRMRLFRCVPVVLCIIVLAWFLPRNYLRAAKGERWMISGQYSPVTEDFIIWESNASGFAFRTIDGKEYPSLRARRLMPFLFYNDVLKHNGFPLTIGGRSFDYKDAARNHTFRLSPSTIFERHNHLHFLMESSPQTANLTMPDSLMIINRDKVRFIDCTTGKEEPEKGRRFTRTLRDSGVVFPIKLSATNTNVRKKFDEGMLLVDANKTLFHLKQIRGVPWCHNLGNTFEGTPLFINVDENVRREYYGQLVTDTNIYLVSYSRGLIRLPLSDYEAATSIIKVWNMPVFQTLVLQNTDINLPTRLIAVDESWRIRAEHAEPTPKAVLEHQQWVNYGLSMISPFRYVLHLPHKPGTIFSLVLAPCWPLALATCLICVIAYLIATRRRFSSFWDTRRLCQQGLEIGIIMVSGLPGLIALLLFGPLVSTLPTPISHPK